MHHPSEFTDRRSKKCSIVSVRGHIAVIDHRNNDCVIEPPCGVDAMAHYHFLLNSPRHGGPAAAQDFLVQIANGKKPVTEMIHRASSFADMEPA